MSGALYLGGVMTVNREKTLSLLTLSRFSTPSCASRQTCEKLQCFYDNVMSNKSVKRLF